MHELIFVVHSLWWDALLTSLDAIGEGGLILHGLIVPGFVDSP